MCVDTSEVPEFHHNVIYKDNILSLRKEEAQLDPADIAAHEKAVREARVKRNGALMALEQLLLLYKSQLFVEVPKLKELMIEPLKLLANTEEVALDEMKGQSVIDALGIVRALLPKWTSHCILISQIIWNCCYLDCNPNIQFSDTLLQNVWQQFVRLFRLKHSPFG